MSFLFPSSTITIDAALRDLATGSAKARAFAAQALGDVTDPTAKRRAVEALVKALDDDLPEVRAEACGSLGELGDPSAIPAITKRLDDGAPVVRQHAAIALGTIGHPNGFEPLATALREGPADLRFQAATSLAEIDEKRAIDPLLAALDDKDPQVTGAVALALGALKEPRTIEPLAAKLAHPDPVTRFDVAYALADLGDDRGRSVLVAQVTDAERSWDAITALANLHGPDDIAALDKAMRDKKTPPESMVLAAGRILLHAPESAFADVAQKALIASLALRNVRVRGLAVEQLGEAGGPWARAPLEKLGKSGKGTEIIDMIELALRKIDAREKGIPFVDDEDDLDDDE